MERQLFTITTTCLITLFIVTHGTIAETRRIDGPWLWMIAPTEAGKGGAASIDIDSLAVVTNSGITEQMVATHGVDEGEQIGNYQWTVGNIDVNPPGLLDLLSVGNINTTLHQIGMVQLGVNLNDYSSYALITVFSNSEQKGQIKVSSDDAIKIWLNGDEVGTVAKNRSANALKFQNVADIQLEQGPNLLMVKVSERTGKWAMYVGLDVPDLITVKQAARTIDLKGPWLWMVAKGGPEDLLNDLLSSQSSAAGEQYRATHGAYQGEREGRNNTEEAIGDSLYWRPGKLNEDGNVNECLIQNGMLKGAVDHYTAYALINIVSVQDNLNVKLRVGSDDAARIWLNGEPVYRYAGHRSSHGYQDEITVRLKLGDNLLMVKISDHDRGWGLFVGLDLPVFEHRKISVSLPPTPRDIWNERRQLPVTLIPDPPISKVAFGKESTYFVFTTKYPQFESKYQGAILYDWCTIMVDMEGVPGFAEGYEMEDEISSDKPIYFMVPLIDADDPIHGFPKHELLPGWVGPAAKKSVELIGGYAMGQAVRKKLIKTAVAKTAVGRTGAGKTVNKASRAVDSGISFIAVLAEAVVQENLSFLLDLVLDLVFPEKPDQIGFVEDSSFLLPPARDGSTDVILSKQEYLFMVDNKRLKELGFEELKEITISVVQQYRFKWAETPEAPGQIYLATYEETLNLDQIFRNEPDQNASSEVSETTPAAPRLRPMSLSDYPPFQQLRPEVQKYLLQYFGEFVSVSDTTDWEIPEVTALLPNYPNPFNPETWLPYQLSKPADVTLTIYDIQGRVVRDLDLGHQRAGLYHSRSRAAYWDGRNTHGESVASGIYFYTLKAGDFAATRKLLIRK